MENTQLGSGDVLLSLGKSDLSDVIRMSTGGLHSHAALYNGDEVLEATLPRVQSLTFRAFTEKSKEISVMRHHTLLPESTERRAEVIEYARAYIPRSYNNVSLVITGAISTITAWIHGNSEWLALNTKFQLNQATRLLKILHVAFKADETLAPQGVTCTELVARAHLEAGLQIDVRLDPAGSLSFKSLFEAIKEVNRRSEKPLATEQGPLSDEDVLRQIEDDIQNASDVRDAIAALQPSSGTKQAPVHVLQALVLPVTEGWTRDAWYAGLVTPAQLARSPSFVPVGRLVPTDWTIERDEALERFNRG